MKEEEPGKLFPTVPFGFEKKAVIAYLAKLNAAYEAELKQKDELIQKLQNRP